MLPAFPKAQKILDDEWLKRMFAAKNKTFPLHLHPSVYPIIEGKTSDFQREDRQVQFFDIKKHSVTAQHSIADGKGMTLKVLDQKANEVGESFGRQMWQSILGVIETAVKETGNEVKVKAGDLKKEDMLRFLEMGHQNFDDEGKPTAQFICGSEFGAELRKREEEWRNDKEFQTQVAEIKQRKLREHNEREARRRLVS